VPSVVFGSAAQAELIEARDWYSARDAELAARFTAEVERVVDRIAAAPQHFPVVYRDVRRRSVPTISVRAVLSGHGRDGARDRLLPQQA